VRWFFYNTSCFGDMKIDNDTVDKIAHLARLEFDGKAKEAIIKDMNNMLAFVEKLNELDTDNVKPLVYMTDETNILREDEVKQEMTQEEALMNAPKKDSDYFKVPKVVERK
jgi:aspartyl-tRNA(Asn)/glutamyl-tRNA(Gln) amidotransferase subunit C